MTTATASDSLSPLSDAVIGGAQGGLFLHAPSREASSLSGLVH